MTRKKNICGMGLAMSTMVGVIAIILSSCVTAPRIARNVTTNDQTGYSLENNDVLFHFDQSHYSVATNGTTGEYRAINGLGPIESVSVAGSFDDWNPGADLMKKEKGHEYALAIPQDRFENLPLKVPFKFVINKIWWVEPPLEASNRIPTGRNNGGFNLELKFPENRYIRILSDLDKYMKLYSENNDVTALKKVVEVLNWDDMYRSKIDDALGGQITADRKSRLMADLGNIRILLSSESRISTSGDVDILIGTYQRNPQFQEKVNEIEVIVGDQYNLMRRTTIKAVAFWMLVGRANTDAKLRSYLQEHLRDMNPSARTMLAPLIMRVGHDMGTT